jgi:hypothetical protein
MDWPDGLAGWIRIKRPLKVPIFGKNLRRFLSCNKLIKDD